MFKSPSMVFFPLIRNTLSFLCYSGSPCPPWQYQLPGRHEGSCFFIFIHLCFIFTFPLMLCMCIRGLSKDVIICMQCTIISHTELIPLSCLGQVTRSSLTTVRTDWTHRHEEAKQHFSSQVPLTDSLLDTVESQGAATWSGVRVPVVVQRVYSLPCRCQQGGGSAASLISDPPKVR